MATYNSEAYEGGFIARTLGDQPAEITATVYVPAGTALQTADKLYFFRVGPNHWVDEVSVRFEALDNAQTATLTVDVGYEAEVATDDPNAFVSASTLSRLGGQVQVENGGDDPFAVGALAPLTEVMHVMAQPAASAASAAGSGALGTGAAAKAITCTAKISRKITGPDGTGASYTYPVI